ncbi:hypothetical protein B0H14DRAFT_3147859 [Mycena olivaceomarginata]|nr:hypothetical protein B0H14DRAFT_3147859 [Mycena olivaceomarginata]
MHCPSICLMYLRSAYTTLLLFAAHIAQIQNRTPLSEIDSIQHILQDGTVISTQERVVNSCNFRKWNKLLSIIHAHEAQDLGQRYCMYCKTTTTGFPLGDHGLLRHRTTSICITTRGQRSRWSPPFVGEKITDMLIAVLNTCTTEECEEEEDVLMPENAHFAVLCVSRGGCAAQGSLVALRWKVAAAVNTITMARVLKSGSGVKIGAFYVFWYDAQLLPLSKPQPRVQHGPSELCTSLILHLDLSRLTWVLSVGAVSSYPQLFGSHLSTHLGSAESERRISMVSAFNEGLLFIGHWDMIKRVGWRDFNGLVVPPQRETTLVQQPRYGLYLSCGGA